MHRHAIRRFSISSLCVLLTYSTILAGPPQWLSNTADSTKGLQYPAEATFAVLLSDCVAELSADGTVRSHVRRVIKVLKSDGVSGAVLRELVNPSRSVEDLKGWQLLPTGECRSMGKENVATTADNSAAGVYSDDSYLMAVAGDLTPGSIAAYEYTVVERDGWVGLYDVMLFQVQEPVWRARYALTVPSTWQLRYSLRNADSCQFSRAGSTYTWAMSGLPYRSEEPFMPPWTYLMRYLGITGGDTTPSRVPAYLDWASAGRWYDSLFNVVVTLDSTVRQQAATLTAGLGSAQEKATALAAYVRDNIRYVAVETDRGGQIPREPRRTLANRYGDCKDKTALLHSLLSAIGVHSIPVLASVGRSVDSKVPTHMQFNHCILGIAPNDIGWTDSTSPALAHGWLLCDPTAEGIPLGELPMALYGSHVLMAGAGDYELVYLPYLSPDLNTRRLQLVGHVDAHGNISGKVSITAYGPVALEGKELYRTMPQDRQIDDLRELIDELIPGATIDSFARRSTDDSLVTTFQIRPTKSFNPASSLSLLTVNPLSDERPVAMKTGKRELPIWFGYGLKVIYEIDWELDSTLVVDGDYPAVHASVDSCWVDASTVVSSHHIKLNATICRDGRVIDPAKYEAARTFRRACDKLLGYKVAIKRI